MITTKLSDFTEDQLLLIGKTLIYKKLENQDVIDGWETYPELSTMFTKDIELLRKQNEELTTLITQFTYAAAQKKFQARTLMN